MKGFNYNNIINKFLLPRSNQNLYSNSQQMQGCYCSGMSALKACLNLKPWETCIDTEDSMEY
jgi:hypothetical protein